MPGTREGDREDMSKSAWDAECDRIPSYVQKRIDASKTSGAKVVYLSTIDETEKEWTARMTAFLREQPALSGKKYSMQVLIASDYFDPPYLEMYGEETGGHGFSGLQDMMVCGRRLQAEGRAWHFTGRECIGDRLVGFTEALKRGEIEKI